MANSASPSETKSSSAPLASKHDARTLANLQENIGRLATATTRQLDLALPWFRRLSPEERSALGLLAHNGISSFVSYYRRPSSPGWVLTDLFGNAPTELTSSISLQKALQLIRIVVQVVEDRVPDLAAEGDEASLREVVLRYAREVAFAAADVYARAAETRGAWDSRLESVIVDAIVRGESTDALRSRIAALGWKSTGQFSVVVGTTPDDAGSAFVSELRRAASALAEDALVGIQGERLIVVLGGVSEPERTFTRLGERFGDGPIVFGPEVESLLEASGSARAAFAGLAAVQAWPQAPRPVAANDLWPERALNGDVEAKRALVLQIYRPLLGAGNALLETLSSYLALGHSLEATARELFVHANTVRYRLRRVIDVTGWDPLIPREAFVLQTALAVGRLQNSIPAKNKRAAAKSQHVPVQNPVSAHPAVKL